MPKTSASGCGRSRTVRTAWCLKWKTAGRAFRRASGSRFSSRSGAANTRTRRPEVPGWVWRLRSSGRKSSVARLRSARPTVHPARASGWSCQRSSLRGRDDGDFRPEALMFFRSRLTIALVGFFLLLSLSATAQPPDQKKTPGDPKPRLDFDGDPLPEGAVGRLGSTRLRHLAQAGVFSPDSKRLITWGNAGVCVVDVATGEVLSQSQRWGTLAVWFGPDGKSGTVVTTGGSVLPWESKTGFGEQLAFSKEGGATAGAFAANGKTVARGTSDGSIQIHDVGSGKFVTKLTGPTDGVRGLAFSPDGKLLARAGERSVGLWDVATGNETRLLEVNRDGSPFCAAFSPDGKVLVTGEYFGKVPVRAWDVATKKELFAIEDLPFGYFPRAVSFATDGKTFAHTGEGGVVFLRDAATGKEIRRFKTERNTYSVAISPDGKTIAAAVSQYPAGWETRIFDVETGKERFAFPRHELEIEAVFFTPDGKKAVTSGIDRTVRVWDATTGKHLFAIGEKKIEDIRQKGRPCALSSDGKTLLVAWEGVISVWDIGTAKEIRKLNSPEGQVIALSFAPSGKSVAVLCMENKAQAASHMPYFEHAVHVLNVETGKSSVTIPGLNSAVQQLTVPAEGTLIAVGAPNAPYGDGITLYSPAGRKLFAFVQAK